MRQHAWQHALVGLVVAMYVQGMYLAKSVDDVAKLLATAPMILFPVMGAYGWKKFVEAKNGVQPAAGDKGSAAGH